MTCQMVAQSKVAKTDSKIGQFLMRANIINNVHRIVHNVCLIPALGITLRFLLRYTINDESMTMYDCYDSRSVRCVHQVQLGGENLTLWHAQAYWQTRVLPGLNIAPAALAAGTHRPRRGGGRHSHRASPMHQRQRHQLPTQLGNCQPQNLNVNPWPTNHGL